ncbi:hypothetical protein [Methanosarcina sp. KYL-1]|nr:hypothetical protein [Methanosarcina sp. KYL-1]
MPESKTSHPTGNRINKRQYAETTTTSDFPAKPLTLNAVTSVRL